MMSMSEQKPTLPYELRSPQAKLVYLILLATEEPTLTKRSSY